NPGHQEAVRKEASQAIQQFLQDKTPIPVNIRRLIRELPDLAPEAATTTRELSMHVLGDYRDGYPDRGGFIIHGIPFSAADSLAVNGALNCGCTIDSGLWDFYLNKVVSIRSHNPMLPGIEFLKGSLTSRHRAFVVKIIESMSSLTIDDLYTGEGVVYGSPDYLFRIKQLQIVRLLAETQALLPMVTENK
ncbi:hypothetical protein C8R44DRAFT_614996, partial [Mycena epipterygia]